MKQVHVIRGRVEDKERLLLHFEYDREVIALVKQIPGARWSPAERCWHVSVLAGSVEKMNERFEGKLVFEEEEKESKGKEEMGRKGEVLEEEVKVMVLKGYSKNTRRLYKSMMNSYLEYYREKDPKEITEEEIREYLLYLIEKRKVSNSYQNQAINAIKFYYEKVLGRPVKTYYVERPKREKRLPEVLSEEEVKKLLNSVDNLKHKCILSITYSAGLRISEVLNLKAGDIDSKRNYVIIRQGKGKKDRYSLLSAKVLELLRQYYIDYRPEEWLFEGQFGGQYGVTSIHNILKAAVKKAGIRKRVTMHTLRHSFATHLLERGTDIRYIQTLLGHESSRTTEIYTHITQRGLGKIKSPLDDLGL